MTFDEFTRTRLAPLLRFATMLCIDVGLAEDLVQEVLIKAHARWDRIEPLDHPEAYVRRMVVNDSYRGAGNGPGSSRSRRSSHRATCEITLTAKPSATPYSAGSSGSPLASVR